MSATVRYSDENMKHQVIVDGEVVGEFDTNAEAWRKADRLANEPLNRAQSLGDFIFSRQAARGDLYRAKAK